MVDEERTYGLHRRDVNAMNITHGLRRALQVKSCGTATIFEGRRRTWQEIGDRVSRFAGAFRVDETLRHANRIGLKFRPGSGVSASYSPAGTGHIRRSTPSCRTT